MKHHGINQPRGMNAEAAAEGRFGRMFPKLPRLISNPKDLEAAGEVGGPMDESNGKDSTTDIPLGFVFLGQFIDHDITLDITSSFNKLNDPGATKNFRTPALDLDCIYGSGPEASPFLYYQAPDNGSDRQNEISGRHLLTNGADLVRAPSAPEGNTKRAALIGDPRNDENRVVSQVQLLFHYFHNTVVDHVLEERKAKGESIDGHEVFEEAQRLTRWHYQWVIVHDFLKRMVGEETVNDILCNGTRLYQIEKQPYIPVEFSAAAYRFGHTMVTKNVKYNKECKDVELFGPELGKGFTVNQAGAANMDYFFGPKAQPAGAVDIKLQSDLLDLPFLPPSVPAAERSLATRNLLRSQSFGLPSGQNVHQAISEKLGEELPKPKLHNLGLPEQLEKSTPLWLYILAEGSLTKGQQLGPVGGRIIAEVLIGLLESDKTSFMGANPAWFPTLSENGVWDMESLVKYSKFAEHTL